MKTIYFDFDGTLHDTATIYRRAVQKSYDELRLEANLPPRKISLKEASGWLGMTPPAMWKDFLPQLDEAITRKATLAVGREMERQLRAGQGRLYPGTLMVLKALKDKGYQLKILSNCRETYKDSALKAYGLEEYISDFIPAERYDYLPKHQILQKIKGEDDLIAFVGDKENDLEIGRYFSLLTVGCRYGYGTTEELQTAKVIIDDIRELLKLF